MPKRISDDQIKAPFSKLNENDALLLDAAKQRGYLIQKGEKWGKLKKAFYDWCITNQRTFICIEQDRFISTIEVDDYTRGFDSLISESAYERFVQIAVQYLDPYGPGDFLMAIRHIPNDKVEKVAQEIVELFSEELDEERHNYSFSYEAIVNKVLANNKKKWAKVDSKTGEKIRSREVVLEVRNRAQGICELCSKAAPFIDSFGNPYLEVHHVVWLSRGGEDIVENAVALCPNCHRKMHILDLPKDRGYLSQLARTKKLGII